MPRHLRNSLCTTILPFALAVGAMVVSEQQLFAPPFVVNSERLDPYKNFKFRVKWDGAYIAGIAYVSPLNRSTEVIDNREGGTLGVLRKSPGLTQFAPIILRRGVTHDTAFEAWANKVRRHQPNGGAEVSLKDFRKNIIIEVLNESGQLVRSYAVYRCWPSTYEAMSELDANGNTVLIESLILQNEGWERDAQVVEPAEESFGQSK